MERETILSNIYDPFSPLLSSNWSIIYLKKKPSSILAATAYDTIR